ncbi:Gfo/Idh/MocA family oxidoreductase [Acidobacteria bacterium AH-259-D05]|nr:Gfo/Idh/MocA family oxidoreductase [Acidobacteria bacterium AH-259-D05]
MAIDTRPVGPPKQVLVTGATGFIGRHAVRTLLDSGYSVRVLVRRKRAWSEWLTSQVKQMVGDITDSSTVYAAVRGASAVIHLAGLTSEKPARMSESLAVNVKGTENLIAACRSCNARRIVFVSSQSTKRERRGPYGESKRQADELLLTSGLDVTILKPTLVYGPGARGIFARLNKWVHRLPIVPVIGSGEYRVQPVWVSDVAKAIRACLESPNTVGRIYDLAGGDRLTFNQFIDILSAGERGVSKRKLHVPYQLGLWGARLAAALPNSPLTADNVLGLVQETQIDLEPARRDFGFVPVSLAKGLRLSREYAPNKRADARRVVVIGMGKMGLVHSSIVNALPHGQLVGVMDINHKMRTFVRSWGIQSPFYTNVVSMLDETQPDAAIVCVPPASTRSVLIECLSRDIHVLVEKPLANSLSNAQAISELSEGRRSLVSVAFMVAFHPTFAHARQLVRKGILGFLTRVEARAFQSQVFSPKSGWRYDKAQSGGGVLPIVASHTLFLLYWYFGRPQLVEAKVRSIYSEVEDEASAKITFLSGLEAHLEASWSRPGYLQMMQSIEVTGDNGSLSVTSNRIKLTLNHPCCDYPAGESLIHCSDLPSAHREVGADGYYSQDCAFLQSLLTGNPPRVTLRDGLAVQAMLDAIYRAAEAGESVEIADLPYSE